MSKTEPIAKKSQYTINYDSAWVRTLTLVTVDNAAFIHTSGIDPTTDEDTEAANRAALIVRAVNGHEVAVRLSNALDAYLKAEHNGDVPKKRDAWIELLDAQQAWEKVSK